MAPEGESHALKGRPEKAVAGIALREGLYNAVWGWGVRMVHLGKCLGISGPFERASEKAALRFIPAPKEEVEISLGTGIRLVVPPGFPRARTYAAGTYEREVTYLFRTLVNEGMRVVDVGAFCGYYTLLASRLVAASGQVYAFEADPDNYSYLLRNIEANGISNVVSAERAVSNKTGIAALALHREADHRWLLSSQSSATSITVQSVTLDDFFAQEGWPPIHLIKMDIEGGEMAALEGMRELSRRNPHLALIMEFDLANLRRAGATAEAVATILQELGFGTGNTIEQGMKPFSVSAGLPRTDATYNLLLKKE